MIGWLVRKARHPACRTALAQGRQSSTGNHGKTAPLRCSSPDDQQQLQGHPPTHPQAHLELSMVRGGIGQRGAGLQAL